MKPKKLIPVTQLIDLPLEVQISSERLELATLADLPRNLDLLTAVGALQVVVRLDGELRVKVIRKVLGDEPLAVQYGVRTVARTMSDATGYVPLDQGEAKRLPRIEAAGWQIPDQVDWKFALPTTSTGAQVLDAVRVSDEFVMQTTEALLAQRTKAEEPSAPT